MVILCVKWMRKKTWVVRCPSKRLNDWRVGRKRKATWWTPQKFLQSRAQVRWPSSSAQPRQLSAPRKDDAETLIRSTAPPSPPPSLLGGPVLETRA